MTNRLVNTALLNQLVTELADEGTTLHWAEISHAEGLTDAELADAISRHVAQEFAARRLPFELGDAAMNFLHANTELSPFSWKVYSCFDVGEYRHAGDPEDIDPADKYTRPRIMRLLADANATGES